MQREVELGHNPRCSTSASDQQAKKIVMRRLVLGMLVSFPLAMLPERVTAEQTPLNLALQAGDHERVTFMLAQRELAS